MATFKLTDAVVKNLSAPAHGNKIHYDCELAGFGVRVTAGGAKSYIFNYRTKGGRERRYTIGTAVDNAGRLVLKPSAARERACALKIERDAGTDPMGDLHKLRRAPTVNELADAFEAEHLPTLRDSTQRDYQGIIKQYIRPEFGALKLPELNRSAIDALHGKVAVLHPYRANRIVSVLQSMLKFAIKRRDLTGENVAYGVDRAEEQPRQRYLSEEEIARFVAGLDAHPERVSANAIKLLLLTGARRSEVLSATWDQFDLRGGTWTKPHTATKQRRMHRVPLSPQAVALLAGMRREGDPDCPHVFRGNGTGRPVTTVRRLWLAACKSAGLAVQVEKRDTRGRVVKAANGKPVMVWQTTARLHDLRHSYASLLVNSGLSLHIVGGLLGHSKPATTARYSHLQDSVMREATGRVGAIVGGVDRPSADVLPLPITWRVG
jgi:integrase